MSHKNTPRSFRMYESTFERRSAKQVQNEMRRKREESRVLNNYEEEDDSFLPDPWGRDTSED